MLDPELAKRIDEILADPDKFRREWLAQSKKENPHLSREQLDAAWEQVAHQFGL